VRFWDTSAIVPLILEETASPACRRELRADPAMAVWMLTRIEIVSAVFRREREGELKAAELKIALRRLDGRTARWTEVTDVAHVRERAERLLAVHPLRAADALQLAAALALFEDRPRGRVFVTRDGALGTAAEREGFATLVPR